jgi:ADP-heptose:LPS heptosyltransferase
MSAGKNWKIMGVSYGVIGDLIMGLPVLTYFEKKHPGSYKYWFIEKKVAFTAPLYLNHPLIDCIRITGEWNGFSNKDYEVANDCQVRCTMSNWKHDVLDWYNYRGQVEETARIAGIYDLKDVLTEEELYPKLNRWFDPGFTDPKSNTYSRNHEGKLMTKTIAIWPFATAGDKLGRSPSPEWWAKLIQLIQNSGYHVMIMGHPMEPQIPCFQGDRSIPYCPEKGFFEQIKISLACKMSIGTDSGPMWVLGAYSHPALHLMTNWLPGHTTNFDALTPVNKNGSVIFNPFKDTSNIDYNDVLNQIERMMNG